MEEKAARRAEKESEREKEDGPTVERDLEFGKL
jgi:hypothetical protein